MGRPFAAGMRPAGRGAARGAPAGPRAPGPACRAGSTQGGWLRGLGGLRRARVRGLVLLLSEDGERVGGGDLRGQREELTVEGGELLLASGPRRPRVRVGVLLPEAAHPRLPVGAHLVEGVGLTTAAF